MANRFPGEDVPRRFAPRTDQAAPATAWTTHTGHTRRSLFGAGAAIVLGLMGTTSCGTGLGRLPFGAAGDATPTAATGPQPAATPRVSPGGMTLTPFGASLAGRLLLVVDSNVWLLERGQPRAITTDRVSRQPSWSPDGKRIALVKFWTSGSDLWALDADGTRGVELTDFTYRADARQNYVLQPIWSADSARILFLSQEDTHDTQLWQVTLTDKRRQRFLSHGETFGGLDHPRLSPNGRTLAVSSFQPGRGPARRPQIWTYALPGGPWRQLTEHAGGAYDPEWSPDGRLAFAVRTPDPVRSTGRHDIWIMNADGTGQRAVTATGLNRAPAWSPDGVWLAYLSARSGTFDVWAVAAPPAGASPTTPPAVTARQVTQNGSIEAASGLAWTR